MATDDSSMQLALKLEHDEEQAVLDRSLAIIYACVLLGDDPDIGTVECDPQTIKGETQAILDRALALKFAGSFAEQVSEIDKSALLSQVERLVVSQKIPTGDELQAPFAESKTGTVDSKRSGAKPDCGERATLVSCAICTEDFLPTKAVKVPCNHFYDVQCLLQLFHMATTDESLMPPRCCRQEIPLDLVKPHMKEDQKTHFSQETG